MRTLFRAYADYCKAGLAVVAQCLDLGLEYMEGVDVWTNGKGSPRAGQVCTMSYSVSRSGKKEDGGMISTAFLEKNVDMLAGYVSLGSNFYWKDNRNERVDVQYVAFFREPLQKFVSEILFMYRDRNLTIDDAVALVNSTMVNDMAIGNYHEKYSTYLITPEQKAWAETQRITWTPGRRANLTLINLVNERVLVGITDFMPQSTELLEYILDGGHEVHNLFQFFGSNEVVKMAKAGARNMTEPVVRAIRQDSALLAMLEEYLKFETRIYDYALLLHRLQYEGFREPRLSGKTL